MTKTVTFVSDRLLNLNTILQAPDKSLNRSENLVKFQAELCTLNSLSAFAEERQKEFLETAMLMYQNPEFEDEKTQRKLFCLLKESCEKDENYEQLLNLIAKMKFAKEAL